MDNIYMLTDGAILANMGKKFEATRLRQNITQRSLASDACVSLSTVKRMENGENCSVDAFLRVMRTLGLLDHLAPLIEDDGPSPVEYTQMLARAAKHKRYRASPDMQQLMVAERSDLGW